MAKVRVPLHQNPRSFATVDDGATKGAQLGRDLYDENGQLLTRASLAGSGGSSGGPNSISSTVWKLIREVPANIVKLAALVGKGFAVRRDDGEWALRTLQEGTGIDIANPDGEAGNPTIGLEDLPNSGAGALLAFTRDAKGRVSGTRAATITGTANQITVTNGTAAAGPPTISLTDLANSGVGAALVKITRDAKGRVAGTAAATTDDLAAGATNKYFPEAPIDGVIYGRKDGAWTAAGAGGGVQTVVAGSGIRVDSTDPLNPVVSASRQAGTFASRPSAVSVPAGTIYFATDAREGYISNGAAWTLLPSGGNELGYAERTSNYSVAAGTTIDVPGLSVTSVVGMGDVSVNFGGTMVMNMTAAGEYANLILYVDGVYTSQLLARAVGDYIVVSRNCRLTGFTPGSLHTFKIGLQSVGGAAATLAGTAADRPYIQVVTL